MAPPPTPGQGSSPAPAATSTPSSSQAPPTDTKFMEGEKILCFHGPLIYEAKIQKVEFKDNQTKYFIHYMGWNKNWDEWVSLIPNQTLSKYANIRVVPCPVHKISWDRPWVSILFLFRVPRPPSSWLVIRNPDFQTSTHDHYQTVPKVFPKHSYSTSKSRHYDWFLRTVFNRWHCWCQIL